MIPYMIHSLEVIFIRLIAYIIKIYANGERDLGSKPYLVLIFGTILHIMICISVYFAFKSMKDEESKSFFRNDNQDTNYQLHFQNHFSFFLFFPEDSEKFRFAKKI